MNRILTTKWIIFDFGGCLDSDGIHSRRLFFQAFRLQGLIAENQWDIFQDAYSRMDQNLVRDGLNDGQNLPQMNDLICRMIAQYLDLSDREAVGRAIDEITRKQACCLNRNKTILLTLKTSFNLAVISNFYGNLDTVLKEFGLYDLFEFIIDSHHAGFQKPDPRIFEQAIKLTGEASSSLCFIGDNPDRDIEPARTLGMKTILIHDREIARNDGGADYKIRSLPEILTLTSLNPA
ncbi:MAG: HAD family hydrolase [Alphaproteobacteria bacterium]|nr:HAD family hydrolase [Alphaproteobacteria bacterium]